MTPDDYNKIVLASVALVSTVSGPLVGWYIANHQTKTQADIAKRTAIDNISEKRQVWIDGVRSDAAEFLAHTAMLATLRNYFLLAESAERKQELEARMLTAFEKVEICGSRVELRLNPSEASHRELIAVARALDLTAKRFIEESVPETPGLFDTYEAQRADVIARVQEILRVEWTRIKEGRV
jgi:hypothetical protein